MSGMRIPSSTGSGTEGSGTGATATLFGTTWLAVTFCFTGAGATSEGTAFGCAHETTVKVTASNTGVILVNVKVLIPDLFQ